MKNSQRNDFSVSVRAIKRMEELQQQLIWNPREHATQDELFPKSWVTE